ncbi:hypothetical protein MLD38_019591 [Melastoma candidum]|uniref:Uncharacterized protein n=1 Tax=Melastoma candidum TaxID=119954 RepID=A0ACB9R105_9MYRT|nr:hypothetical protein MLD38_019591 [Melastoma candidum]
MASSQEKEVRAEAEARQSASDRAWNEPEPEERPGVIGSVMKAVQSAKEAVVGKGHHEDVDYYAGDGGGVTGEATELTRDEKAREAAERARESKQRAKERAGEMTEKAKEAGEETKDYTAEKAREGAERTRQMAESAEEKTKEMGQSAADKTREKATEAKEKTKEMGQSAADKTREKAAEAKEKTMDTGRETKEKAGETAQSAADKTKETTHSATSKLGELKDKAMGLFSGKKEEAKQQSRETAKEKLRETEEETQRRMEELRLKGRDEYEGDIGRKVREDKDEPERRGGGIFGALGALKEKLTPHPSNTDKIQATDKPRVPGTEEVDVAEVHVVEEDVPGTVESTLKASDRRLDEDERVVRVMRLDRPEKK